MIDINKITEIRNGLKMHYGSYKAVAEKAGVSTEMVRLVFKGERRSMKVVLAGASVLVELEQELMDRRREIERRLESIRSLRPSVALSAV